VFTCHIAKHLSDTFPIKNNQKQTDASSSSLVLYFALEYTIRKTQENQVVLKVNGTHQLLVNADHIYWGIT
jgi:hypothetical protein